MEWLIKVVITLVVLFFAAKTIHWTWTSQIDPSATFKKFIKQKPNISETIVTRAPNKIYQNGVVVADISGPVQINGENIYFDQLINTSLLETKKRFEYRRFELKILQIQTRIGQKVVVTSEGSKVLQNVMEGVTCEELK